MAYFHLKKFAQIDNLLRTKGFDEELIQTVLSQPKSKQKYIGQLINQNPNITKEQIIEALQTNSPIQQQEVNPIDRVFENQPVTKEQFFQSIPEAYKSLAIKSLLSGEKKPEDLYTILDIIGEFEKIRKRTALPIQRDINKYQSFAQILEVLNNYAEGSHKENPKLTVDPRKLPGVKLYSSQGEYQIWEVTNAESLMQIGEGTRWCTRASFPASRAEYYLGEYGAIYVITSGPNIVYQFTKNFEEFKDVDDIETKKPANINLDELVRKAIEKNKSAWKNASEQLFNDREFVLEAVKQDGRALREVSEQLKNDREIVLVAVKQNGNALQFASEELKNDREFVLVAVKQNGIALEFASEELKNDSEIVLEAVKKNVYALRYASIELKFDKEFTLAAIKLNVFAYRFASNHLRNDREIVLEAYKQTKINERFIDLIDERDVNAIDLAALLEEKLKQIQSYGWYQITKHSNIIY